MSRRRIRLPSGPTPEVAPGAFVFCPLASLPDVSPEHLAAVKELYQRALAEAAAVVRPSIVERDLLGVWN